MAASNGNPGHTPEEKCARTQYSAYSSSFRHTASVWLGLATSCFAGLAGAQVVVPITSLTSLASVTTGDQAQRRADERERVLREQQGSTPNVRLQQPAPVNAARLRTEPTCFVIQQLEIRAGAGDTNAASSNWGWALDAAAGPTKDDSPIRRCIGVEGVNLVLKRVQDAVIARGYVTTRVVTAPQDLASGTLTFTVLPGRIHAIRFTDASSVRTTQWNAVPARAGDILNLRDVEQALENFKRLLSAEVDIQIQPAAGPDTQPGQSDLLISYQQAFPLRVSLFADDSGSRATGKYQGGVTLSYDNALTLNDLFYVTLNRDLGGGLPGERGTYGDTAHYSAPFGYWLLGTTVSHNRYRQAVAGVNQTYVYSGTSSTVDIKLSRLVYRDAARKTSAGLRAFQRTSSNFIDDTEIQIQRRVVGGFEASVNHKEFIANTTLDVTLAYKRGTGAFGALSAPEQASGEGTSRMQLTTLDASFNAPFKAFDQKLRYTGTLRTQFNHTALTPQDRFAIGGRYTVRGFDGETSLSAERGILLRNELGVALDAWGISGQEAYAGIDYGEVSGPSSNVLVGKSLAGAVLGLRGAYKALHYDLFVGKPISKPDGFRTAQYTAGFSLSFSF